MPNTGEVTIFIYNASGKIVEEYSTILSAEPQVAYLTNDNLGTPRINTAAGGAVISRHDYHPFGEEITGDGRTQGINYDSDDVRQKFTGKQRDSETDLDYFEARYYSSNLGRFSSVDPIGVNLSRMIDPQAINRFIYVRDNPLKYVDKDGKDLTLKAGMTKADVDRIIKYYVKMYNKDSGKPLLQREEKSSTIIEVGKGTLPPAKRDSSGKLIEELNGSTEGIGLQKANGKSFLTKIIVTIDLDKLDRASTDYTMGRRKEQPDTPQNVVYHENEHVDAKLTDPIAEAKLSEKEAEDGAEAFAEKLNKEKDNHDKTAEETVKKMFDYDNYEFADKKKEKKPEH